VRARKIGLELLRCHQQADGNRQIVGGTFFAEIGRRKVDGDAFEGITGHFGEHEGISVRAQNANRLQVIDDAIVLWHGRYVKC